MSRVSVIIPTYNRLESLAEVFPSYLDQACVEEVLVVNDGGTDPFPDLVPKAGTEAAVQGLRFTWLRHSKRRGAAAARNTGLEAATGDLVLFSDDDILLDRSFLEKALRKLSESGADIIGGRVIPLDSLPPLLPGHEGASSGRKGSPVDWLALRGDWTVMTGSDMEVPFVSTVSLWRRWPFDRGVRFDQGFGGNGYREETSAQVSASRLGARIIYSPDLVAWHIGRRPGGQWRKGKLWWYFWTLWNNWGFLRREYPFIRSRYGLRHPAVISFAALALRELQVFLPRALKNMLRGLIRTTGS